MGGGPIDPTQILAGNFGTPGPAPQQAPMTPQAPMPGMSLEDQMKQSQLTSAGMGQTAVQSAQNQLQHGNQQLQGLQQKLGGLSMPKTSVTDEPWMTMQPIRGNGFAGGAKNLLEDIGRGLLAGVASTGPGRSIQQGLYGGGERQYAMQSKNLAEQIASIQEQNKTAAETMNAATNLAVRPGMSYGAVSRGGAAETNAATKAKFEPQRIQLERDANSIKERLGKGQIDQRQAAKELDQKIQAAHDQAFLKATGQKTGTEETIENTREEQKTWEQEIEAPIRDFLGLLPNKPAGPAQPAKPTGGGTQKKSGNVIKWGRDAQGKPVRLSQ